MKVHTKNSTYEVGFQDGQFQARKVSDHYRGGHPTVKNGDVFKGRTLTVTIGEPMQVGPLSTSSVLKVEM